LPVWCQLRTSRCTPQEHNWRTHFAIFQSLDLGHHPKGARSELVENLVVGIYAFNVSNVYRHGFEGADTSLRDFT
jgi:hypothetical protein